jgi:hypothetical protein
VLRHAGGVGEPDVDQLEQGRHGGPHLGVVDPLGGPEHDGPGLPARAQLGEVLLEHFEAGGAAGAGDGGRGAEAGAHGAGGPEDRDEGDQPEADRLGPVVEAPAGDPAQERG